jgi:hypothetical protein
MSEIISELYTVQGRQGANWVDINTSSIRDPSLEKATVEFNFHRDFLDECPTEVPYDEFRLIKETAVQIR